MLTRQILIGQRCLKPFETIGKKLSSWGGGGIRIYLELPRKNVRTYGRKVMS